MAKKVKFWSEGLGLEPVSADPASPSQGQIQYSDGTARTEGVWVYNGSSWIEVIGTDVVACRYTSDAGQSIAATATVVLYEDQDYDTDSAYNTGTGVFDVPTGKGGKYLVTASVLAQAATYTVNQGITCEIQVGTTTVSQSFTTAQAATSLALGAQHSTVLDLADTDSIRIASICSPTANMNTSSGGKAVNLSIIRIGE